MLEISIRICFICNLWVSDFDFWLLKSPKDDRVQRPILGSVVGIQELRDTKEDIEPIFAEVVEGGVVEDESVVFSTGYEFFLVFI